MLDKQIKCRTNRLMLNQLIKSLIKRWKPTLTNQELDQLIKNYFNGYKVRSTDQMLDQQIECYINRSKLDQQIKRINRSIAR